MNKEQERYDNELIKKLKELYKQEPVLRCLIPDMKEYEENCYFEPALAYCSHLLNPFLPKNVYNIIEIIKSNLTDLTDLELAKCKGLKEISWLQKKGSSVKAIDRAEQSWFGNLAEFVFVHWLKKQAEWQEVKLDLEIKEKWDVSAKKEQEYIFEIKCIGTHPDILRIIRQEGTSAGALGDGFSLFFHRVWEASGQINKEKQDNKKKVVVIMFRGELPCFIEAENSIEEALKERLLNINNDPKLFVIFESFSNYFSDIICNQIESEKEELLNKVSNKSSQFEINNPKSPEIYDSLNKFCKTRQKKLKFMDFLEIFTKDKDDIFRKMREQLQKIDELWLLRIDSDYTVNPIFRGSLKI